MKKIKTNPYNFLIPIVEENEFLLYNSLSGGLEVFGHQEGSLFSEIMSFTYYEYYADDSNFAFIEYLLSKEYLLPFDVDVKKLFSKHVEKHQYKKAKTINLTIGTTITCNMGCSYCFEFVKPNHTLKSNIVKEHIAKYVEQIIDQSKGEIETLSVTWYGGEPLINVQAIKDLSEKLIDLSLKKKLKYEGNIVTNGIYLTEDNVRLLNEFNVHSIQVTIDGAKEFHDKKRPLKQKNKRNYEVILENLSKIPNDSKFGINIRMNIDKEVADSASTMLDDFNFYKIWPHKYNLVKFTPAWLRTYEEIDTSEEELELRMDIDEFFEFKQKFREELVNRYNSWAVLNKKKKAKLKWDLPMYQSVCPTWASPSSLTIDPNGNIHKCWETIHDESKAPSTVFENYSPEPFIPYSSFNRYEHNEVCTSCKFLPICDTISCSHEAINSKIPKCTGWKYKLEDYLEGQYLKLKYNPELIANPKNELVENTGHTVK
jgi:uncharacterized protein